MRLKKYLGIAMIVTVLTTSMLAGCGKEESNKDATESTTESTTEENETTEEIETSDIKEVYKDIISEEDCSIDELVGQVELCDYSSIKIDATLQTVTEEEIDEEVASWAKSNELSADTLTDEQVKATEQYDSIAALREDIRQFLQDTYQTSYEAERENQTLDYIIENSKLPKLPAKELEDYKESMFEYYDSYASMYGMGLTDFVSAFFGKTMEEFDEEANTSAVLYVQSQLVLKAIEIDKGLELTETEINEYAETFAEEAGYKSADDLLNELEENNQMEDFKDQILYEKVLKYLFENCVK